jgi:citrate lyase subunit beta-like protein
MLDKSLSTPSDVIIYDLEDSVPPSPHDKDTARQRLSTFLSVRRHVHALHSSSLTLFDGLAHTRVKAPASQPHRCPLKRHQHAFFRERYLPNRRYPLSHNSSPQLSIALPFIQLKSPLVRTLVLPKIHSVRDLHRVSRAIRTSRARTPTPSPIRIVASIESARSAWNLGEIASWASEYGPDVGGKLSALLVRCPLYWHP